MTSTTPSSDLLTRRGPSHGIHKVLARLDRQSSNAGPLTKPPLRKTIGQLPRDEDALALFRGISPVLAALPQELAKQGTNLEPAISTAITDLTASLNEVPNIRSGRASLKVDSPVGCLTIERGITGPWLVYVRLRQGKEGTRHLGYDGYVLQVMWNLTCWSIPQSQIPEVQEAIQQISLCPGAIFRGSTFK